MKVLGVESVGAGVNNQIRGIVLEASKGGEIPCTREEFLKATDGQLLDRTNFDSDVAFEKAISKAVASFCSETAKDSTPDFVVLPFNHAGTEKEGENVDKLSKYLKSAFKDNGVNVKTLVLGSKLYDYKDVDLVNIGKHQLTDAEEKTLNANPRLKNKTILTLGVPSNLSWLRINQEANNPVRQQELNQYKDKKTILFSLGGATENNAIRFELDDAKKLLKYGLKLKSEGYDIVFTNSPRTPNDVTDYLFENSQKFGFNFYNSKKIVEPKEAENNLRVYSGKFNKEFEEQALKTGGNIYPAILSVSDMVINTHDSFSYTSDAAVLGIPSIVYAENKIDFEKRQDCKKLFEICEKGNHIVSLPKAIQLISCQKEVKTEGMKPVNEQIVVAMNNLDNANTINKFRLSSNGR